jgi:hypothetical protein
VAKTKMNNLNEPAGFMTLTLSRASR